MNSKLNNSITKNSIIQNNATNSGNNTNPIQMILKELNNSVLNLSNQIINLHKQLQTSRIDTIFTMLES